MSQVNSFDVSPNWPTPHLFHEKTLMGLTTVLPIITYPFLPSVSRSGVPCHMFLIWPNMLLIMVLMVMPMLENDSGRPDIEGANWQLALLILSLYCGFYGLFFQPTKGVLTRKDFRDMAENIKLAYISSWIREQNQRPDPKLAESDGLLYLLRGLIFYGGPIFFVFLSCMIASHVLPTLILGLVTRRISWWYWLPENGADEDFGPPWSIVLALVVAIAPIVLSIALLDSRGLLMPSATASL